MPDFFDAPILNSPYEAPSRYCDLDAEGRPTGTITKSRRRAEFVAAVPGAVGETQLEMLDLDDLTDEAALQTAVGRCAAWERSHKPASSEGFEGAEP